MEDCEASGHPAKMLGASYRQLIYIVHLVELPDRPTWYYVSEVYGLTPRHAWHIIARIQDRPLEWSLGGTDR